MTDTPIKAAGRSQETQIAVLEVQMQNLDKGMRELGVNLGTFSQTVSTKLDDLTAKFEKEYVPIKEHEELKETVKGIKENVAWGVKIILGIFLAALAGLVMVKGGVSAPGH